MIDNFKLFKLICATIVTAVLLFFMVIGIQTIWNENMGKDYDKHLTEQIYVDTTVHQQVNLVFYKVGCPYCQAGKGAVISAAEKSTYPTFYINVDSKAGQVLVKKYGVEKAATIVQIRDGKAQLFLYATVKNGEKIADRTQIATAFDEKGR
ncbi:thioredoxin [Streptococcus mutans]|uniref:thioredoxin n=1 Tax=Streptococcus mutans TaxID=1309 RepID=UPI0028ED8ED1|nr:thioredoxin [Streptococcus mutans]MDT9519950.1 thioredoxin [Streptococcus mutans]MDT9558052.1 thioredoxin [Streptococcus mutans]MDT9601148.1 thioredoxin [Streptococcus mutans]